MKITEQTIREIFNPIIEIINVIILKSNENHQTQAVPVRVKNDFTFKK